MIGIKKNKLSNKVKIDDIKMDDIKMDDIKIEDGLQIIKIKYNKDTYNIENASFTLEIKLINNEYIYENNKKNKYILNFEYDDIKIKIKINSSTEILYLYVIMQHHYKNKTINELYQNNEWNYEKWKVKIDSIDNNELPDHLVLLNCFLNLKKDYNIPIDINKLENIYELKIKDKRGLGGERPRELNYKFGFPYYTSSTKKNLKNSERIFECPFPINSINPLRKAIINQNDKNSGEKQCFTCRCKENELNIFGQPCKFEKGHLVPIKEKNTQNALWQCKWCNTFYKDKIIWNLEKKKVEFNTYAVMRDTKKEELINIIKKLGISSNDLIK